MSGKKLVDFELLEYFAKAYKLIMEELASNGGFTIDDELSLNSDNPVQNSIIAAALSERAINKMLTTLDEVNNPDLESGVYSAEGVSMTFPCGAKDYFVLIANKHRYQTGYGVQIAIPYTGGNMVGVYYRNCKAGTWGAWQNVADGGNAAKVNGLTVQTAVPANAKFTDTVYTHPSGTAKTGNPTANQTPAFGGTFTVTQFTSNATGHISGATDRTVKIPNTQASASAAGLVSTGAQTFGGNKTFNGQILPNGATAYGTPQARKMASGTAAATTTNCPSGAWYGKHS